jgi:hypothetical protein
MSGTRISVTVHTHDLDSALRAVRAFLDEIEEYDDPVRGTYIIGREHAKPVGKGTIEDVADP